MNRKQRAYAVATFVLSGAVGFAIYYYRATQEFEITGELLYKNKNDVRPVAGAYLQVFEDTRESHAPNSPNTKYSLLLMRQLYLSSSPEHYDPAHDAELAPLHLNTLSKITTDWFGWESERLSSCMWAERLFREQLKNSLPVATTSTNMSGHFWLGLRRGRYIITTMNEVASYRHLGSEPPQWNEEIASDGAAFWAIPVTLTGNIKVVSAAPICGP